MSLPARQFRFAPSTWTNARFSSLAATQPKLNQRYSTLRRDQSGNSIHIASFSAVSHPCNEPSITPLLSRQGVYRSRHCNFSTSCAANAYNSPSYQKPSTATTSSNASSQKPSTSSSSPKAPHPMQNSSGSSPVEAVGDLASGLKERTMDNPSDDSSRDWTRSFHGLSTEPFPPEVANILLAPVKPTDVEIKADGLLYLPEIKYRRVLNQAFGPGGWGLAPRGETIVTARSVTREYALVALGRLVSVARGEQDYFNPEGIPTAVEGCKSSALRRCCKDLGIASELWDPRFIREFIAKHTKSVFAEHVPSGKKKKITLRKDDVITYPYKECGRGS